MKGRIYIAGPMTGYLNHNKDKFYKVEEELKELGWEVENPAYIPIQEKYEDYWPLDKELLDKCNTIYMLRGWENSKGALLEYNYAKENGYTIMYEECRE